MKKKLQGKDLDNLCDRLGDIVTTVTESETESERSTLLAELAVATEELNVAVEEISKQADEIAIAKNLAESAKRKYYELFHSAPDGYIVTDKKGRILEANKAAGDLLCVRPEERLKGKPFTIFISRTGRAETHDLIDELSSGEKHIVKDIELTLLPRAAEPFHASVTIASTTNSENLPSGMLWLIRDITERKAAQMELAETVSTLARSNKEIEQFAYAAAHDLKEPLRTISTYSQLLRQDQLSALSDDGRIYLRTISESVTKVLSLVDDLLMYSSANESKEVRAQQIPVKDAIAEALAFHSTTIRETKAKVVTENLDSAQVPHVQFVLVLRNLLGNALKFRRKAAPQVRIGFKRDGNLWICSVEDKGIGIQEEYSKKIFQMFQRLHGDEEFPGNGIGLAVCKKVVQSWGGDIWVESEYGKGSRFKFSLPVA